jgi:hypothetical protein
MITAGIAALEIRGATRRLAHSARPDAPLVPAKRKRTR